MSDPFAARRSAFRALHREGCFLLPNPWDAGSARYLAREGFKALATTSSGAAWSRGLADGAMALEATLESIATIVQATELPVNADFGHGFGRDAAEVAEAVTRCVATGVAGLSVEDATGDPARPLFPLAESVARLRAARDAIDASGADVMLVGRAECFLTGHPDPLAESLRRVAAYRDAGAAVIYVPGLATPAAIEAVVRAAGDCPVNVLVHRPIGLSLADLAALGVRRVSIGGALAAIAWRAVTEAVSRLKSGDLEALGARMPGSHLDEYFAWRGDISMNPAQ
ncbi:isocitrate lyase/PEP mutase family protein [Falsiroseomonas ponticola]|jgi:2-methylisocitrate lyase-like PEP mutase family enzyme|uniref:isocitrate lyase/PEP mutase family protein n=1 Tax=Falsiroseomonas ponticola TaxID=2786951 RepID=UPI001933C11D|nr:isocitrate lyase/phosphoenolpyruvate mutase family protein [Roseomonas ponticola]